MLDIDVIIPTIRGREASLQRLKDSLVKHTPPEMIRTIVIENAETCGKGWKEGLEQSDAPYVLLACDDQMVVSDTWAERGMEAANKGFIACPRVWMSDGVIESQGGDMKAFAHVSPRPKRDWTQVDYTTVPFLSREAIDQIGMLEIHYASDVWVSYRGRQLGYESVLRHGFDIVHFQEQVGRGAGMSQGERDAVDCEVLWRELEAVTA